MSGVRNDSDSAASGQEFAQSRRRFGRRYEMKVALANEMRRQCGYEVNIENTAQARNPPGFMAAHLEVFEQGCFHGMVIGVAADVFIERRMAGTVRTFGIKQDTTSGP